MEHRDVVIDIAVRQLDVRAKAAGCGHGGDRGQKKQPAPGGIHRSHFELSGDKDKRIAHRQNAGGRDDRQPRIFILAAAGKPSVLGPLSP